jgi:ParB-like chromosome segregation protein Spo0J
VPAELVQANDYNPNAVATVEMTLLVRSIQHDGFTQPIVAIFDAALGKYVIVDGFHRYYVGRNSPEVRTRTHGFLPLVVLDKSINERMAATVRHNRARGKHSVNGMANMVFQMLDNGMADSDICNELGMEPEELLRLKHITGFSKLYKDQAYNRAWHTKNQIRLAIAKQKTEKAGSNGAGTTGPA